MTILDTVTPIDGPSAVDSETQRVNDAIDALLAAHDPRTTAHVAFRGARYDAGLAWRRIVSATSARAGAPAEVGRLTNVRAGQNARVGNPGPEMSIAKLAYRQGPPLDPGAAQLIGCRRGPR